MEKFKIYGENGENQNQMNWRVTKNGLKVKNPVFRQICERCNLRLFFGFVFCCLLDQNLKGQFR